MAQASWLRSGVVMAGLFLMTGCPGGDCDVVGERGTCPEGSICRINVDRTYCRVEGGSCILEAGGGNGGCPDPLQTCVQEGDQGICVTQ